MNAEAPCSGPDDERLSSYVDGLLAPAERAAVEDHLERCGACRAVVDDLRGVVERAARLADRPPARDLWPAIAADIGARRRGLYRAALAAAALIAVVATLWLVPGGAPPDPRLPSVESATAERRALLVGRGLPPDVRREIETDLAIYDGALAEIRTALEAEPRDPFLQRHLDRTLRRRLDYLDTALRLAEGDNP